MSAKIVVTGDVNGRLREVFGKLGSLHAKQGFAFAIIAGNLFSDVLTTSEEENDELQKLLNDEIEIPLPTYFSLGTQPLPPAVLERLKSTGTEICTNLTLLGRKLSMKTTEGFRIVAVGGSHATDESAAIDPFEPTYTDVDTRAFSKDADAVDILVTSQWPKDIQRGSKVPNSARASHEVQSIAELCTELSPRYHFSTSSAYYEREPFFHTGTSPLKITRFVSLAPFGNLDKQKWIYAFNLEPSAPPPPSTDPSWTASPFRISKKRKLDEPDQSSTNFRYANGNGSNYATFERGNRKRQRFQPPPTPSECFFCLSNDACETHMITSIGSDSYLAVAKGPLSTPSTFPDLGFSGHILSIPLQHSPTIDAIPEKSVRQSTVSELQRYREAMHTMLKTISKDDTGRSRLGAVTWEVSRSRGVHVHWQFLPVPVEMVQKGLVETAFDVEAENLNYPRFAKSAHDIAKVEDGDYTKIMIWSEALRKDMVLPVDGSYRFDLQFARKVLAKLLGLEDRMDWRACSQDKKEEEADAIKFKAAFKAFDFSLEDD